MKQNAIKVGRPYMVSLGRRGSVRAVCVARFQLVDTFVKLERGEALFIVSSRRLSPVPVTDANGAHIGSEVAA